MLDLCKALGTNTSSNDLVTLDSNPRMHPMSINTAVHLRSLYSNRDLPKVIQENCCRENSLGEVAMETVCITVLALLLLSLIGLLIITILEARRVRRHYSKENHIIDDDIYIELDDLEGDYGDLNHDEATRKSMNDIKNMYEEIPDNYVINAVRHIPDYTDPPDVIEEDIREDEDVNRIMNLLFVEPIRNSQAPPSPIPCTLPSLMEEEPNVNNWKTIRRQLKKIRNMKVGNDGKRDSLPDREAQLSWRETILQEVNRRASEVDDINTFQDRINSFSLSEKRSPSVTFSTSEKRSPSVTFSTSEKRSPRVAFNENKKRNSSVISGLSNFSRDSRNSRSSCRNSSVTSEGSTDCDHSLDYHGEIMEQKNLRRSLKRKKGPKVSNSNSSSVCGKNVCLSPEMGHRGARGRRVGGIMKLPPSHGHIMKLPPSHGHIMKLPPSHGHIMKTSPSNGALINYKKKRRQGVSFSETDHHTSYDLHVISRHPNLNKTSTKV